MSSSSEKNGRPFTIDWEQWDAVLGSESDRAIADAIGCHVQTVKQRRLDLGIAPAHPGKSNHGKRINWRVWDKRTRGLSDREAANLIGCSQPTVSNRRREQGIAPLQHQIRWTPAKLKLLEGQLTVKQIARRLGTTPGAVYIRRFKLRAERSI